MNEGGIFMSVKEAERQHVLQLLIEKHLKQKQAAMMLGISIRQVKRLLRGFKQHGPCILISKKRGKASNNKYTDDFKRAIQTIIGSQYHDFGPTLASEYLAERDGYKVAVETIRGWMIEAKIWVPNLVKEAKVHPPRLRRPCYGELIQIDGSPHDWFEGRGPECTLIVFIDDATSKIQLMRFFPAETTFAYFEMANLYMRKYGKPVAFYSDKHSVFRVNREEAVSGTGFTQFGRAMEALEIELIHAHSPQAKGRVERANKTLQDRLIKWMRLENISDIETANRRLDEYIKKHNAQFAHPPREAQNMHRTLVNEERLEYHLSKHTFRKVNKNICVNFHGQTFKLEIPGKGHRLRQAKVTVCEHESGKITIQHKGNSLPYTVYDKKRHYSEPVDGKGLVALFSIKSSSGHKPPKDHPWNQASRLGAAKKKHRADKK